jgi:hypothetical protein
MQPPHKARHALQFVILFHASYEALYGYLTWARDKVTRFAFF